MQPGVNQNIHLRNPTKYTHMYRFKIRPNLFNPYIRCQKGIVHQIWFLRNGDLDYWEVKWNPTMNYKCFHLLNCYVELVRKCRVSFTESCFISLLEKEINNVLWNHHCSLGTLTFMDFVGQRNFYQGKLKFIWNKRNKSNQLTLKFWNQEHAFFLLFLKKIPPPFLRIWMSNPKTI